MWSWALSLVLLLMPEKIGVYSVPSKPPPSDPLGYPVVPKTANSWACPLVHDLWYVVKFSVERVKILHKACSIVACWSHRFEVNYMTRTIDGYGAYVAKVRMVPSSSSGTDLLLMLWSAYHDSKYAWSSCAVPLPRPQLLSSPTKRDWWAQKMALEKCPRNIIQATGTTDHHCFALFILPPMCSSSHKHGDTYTLLAGAFQGPVPEGSWGRHKLIFQSSLSETQLRASHSPGLGKCRIGMT